MKRTKTSQLAMISMLTALSLALAHLHLPTPNGFVSLLDVGIYFTAFYLGKKEGAVVGALSGLLIDLLLGYPQWAMFSLLFHGGQGYFAGWTGRRRLLGLLLASLVMVGGYFLASSLMYTVAAAAADVLGNSLQNLVGLILGYLLTQLVHKTGVLNYVFKRN